MTAQEIIRLVSEGVTTLTLLGAAAGWWLTRKQRDAAGDRAMQQINVMATNHFPHMEASLKELSSHAENQNKILEKQGEILASIDSGIKILVDRGR